MRDQVFKQFPRRECIFDQECVALCSGEIQRLTQDEYRKLVANEQKLDQLAMLLVNFKRDLRNDQLHDVLYVLPRISTFEFTSFRDGKVDLDKLKCKVMGIKPDAMMTKGELIKAGV